MDYEVVAFYMILFVGGGALGYLYGGYVKGKAIEKYMALGAMVKKVAESAGLNKP